MTFAIGASVIDRWGHRGKVSAMYDDFSACSAHFICDTPLDWLIAQERPFTKEHLAEMWYSVVIDLEEGGGAICSPESELRPVT